MLFSSPESAESGAAKIERQAKDFGDEFEFTNLEVSGDIVTFTITLLGW